MGNLFKKKLDTIAEKSLYTTFTNSATINYSLEIFRRFLIQGSILELGPAEGLMTNKLTKLSNDITVIEGSSIFSKMLKQKFPDVNVVNELFESYKLNKLFDNIILGHVLEHVQDPKIVLHRIKNNLKSGGIVLCAVPNARSVHRQAAVIMGLIDSEYSLSSKDIHHGHHRIYNPETLRNEFIASGYKIIFFGGYWLKPISDKQIEETWDEKMLFSFLCLGERYPDIAAEIYVIATL